MPKTAIPVNADELQEILNDPKRLKNIAEDPSDFKEFIQNYVNASLKNDRGVLDQVREQAEATAIDFLRKNGIDNLRNIDMTGVNSRAARKRSQLYNKDAIGAKYDDAFKSFGDMLFNVRKAEYRSPELSKKLESLKNDLSSVKPSDGGFLIPEVLRSEILQTALETAIVRSRAVVIPMDSLKVPIPSLDSTSNVSSIFGGIVGSWTEEGASLTESQPRFGRVVLEAHKLSLYTEVPNELVQDAIAAFNAFIDTMFPQAIAWFEDVAFFLGTGVGEPLGFMNAPARIQVTRAGGGNAIDWADVVGMYSRMLPQSINRAVWITSPDSLPSIFQLTNGGYPVFLGSGLATGGTDGPPMTLLGRPLLISEKAAASGSAGDLNFVDFGMYLIGDRQAMSVRQSEEYRFQNDLTAFRVIERVDGRPWLASPITPKNGSANTLSPFIQLL